MINQNPTQDTFELTLARPVSTQAGEHAALVHLWWRAAQQGDCLVQVYVDGALADVTPDPAQREMWLMCERTKAHTIELLAIPRPSDADLEEYDPWQAHPSLLRSWSPPFTQHASLALMREAQLPVDTVVRVDVDGQKLDAGPLWDGSAHRGGAGALFGVGEFGRDEATGPGLGGGELGMGPLGADGSTWRWRRDTLSPGEHSIDVSAVDRTGQPVAPLQALGVITIEALPAAAQTFDVEPDFTLTWQP